MELQVNRLCKSYDGRPVLSGLSFTAPVGVTCICAPSGIGKTTLLRILLGLETPDAGTTNARSLRWSADFQEARLLEQLDAAGNLRFALGAQYDAVCAKRMLARLALSDVGGKKVQDFSGGMKQRLSLARALLFPSDAAALDEPFSGLDGENRERAYRCIREAAKERIVLLVTHDEADAKALDAAIIRLQ